MIEEGESRSFIEEMNALDVHDTHITGYTGKHHVHSLEKAQRLRVEGCGLGLGMAPLAHIRSHGASTLHHLE